MFGRFPLQRKVNIKIFFSIEMSICVLCSFLAAMVDVKEDDKKLSCSPGAHVGGVGGAS